MNECVKLSLGSTSTNGIIDAETYQTLKTRVSKYQPSTLISDGIIKFLYRTDTGSNLTVYTDLYSRYIGLENDEYTKDTSYHIGPHLYGILFRPQKKITGAIVTNPYTIIMEMLRIEYTFSIKDRDYIIRCCHVLTNPLKTSSDAFILKYNPKFTIDIFAKSRDDIDYLIKTGVFF